MSYNSREIAALVAPLFGLAMEDLTCVVVVAGTADGRIVFCDSRVGNQEPSGPEAGTGTSTPAQAARTVQHLLYCAHQILEGCVVGRLDA